MRNVRFIVSRQTGHLVNNLAQLRHDTIWPHSINAQLASASKQTLHVSSEFNADDDSRDVFDNIDRADAPVSSCEIDNDSKIKYDL